MSMEGGKKQSHFVLVHGACHGAWCWYKLKPLLEASGHRVTAIDLAASGINFEKIEKIRTIQDYNLPLMETMASVPLGEKVVLVGHSLGGLNLAFAMDKYPEKVSVAVFVSAYLPDYVHKPSYVMDVQDELLEKTSPETLRQGLRYETIGTPEDPLKIMWFDPKFLASNLYQQSSIQDLTLATMLTRPVSVFEEDMTKLSKEGYGSVARAYIMDSDDKAITEGFQRWMIENSGEVKEVMEIKGADHMAMLSKPKELCSCLLEIANKLA